MNLKVESVPFYDFLYPIDVFTDPCIYVRIGPFGTSISPAYNTLNLTIAYKWSTVVTIA